MRGPFAAVLALGVAAVSVAAALVIGGLSERFGARPGERGGA
jgi:hypothetical protein